MVRMQVHWIALDDKNRSVAILREGPGHGEWSPRVLLVPIEPPQAKAIARALGEGQSVRPMTHDLLVSTLEATDAEVLCVLLQPDERPGDSHFVPGVQRRCSRGERGYAGEVHVQHEGAVYRLPAAAGDALALAVLADAPVMVSWELADKRTVLLQEDDSDELARFRHLMRGIEAS